MTNDTPTRTPEMGGTAKWAGSDHTSPASTSGANPDGPAHPSEHRYTYPATPKGMEPDALVRVWTTNIGIALEDAMDCRGRGKYDEADTMTRLADAMLRYLELRERQETAS